MIYYIPINYQKGHITIYCANGIISDNLNLKKNNKNFIIEKKIIDNNICDYYVNDKKFIFYLNKKTNFFDKLKLKKINNLSIEKKEKILSLIKILSKEYQNKYIIEYGIYDSLVFKILDKYKFFIDIIIVKFSLISFLFKFIRN